MSDPALSIQGAVYNALKVLGRVYDTVPEAPVFPYMQIGDSQSIGDFADCIDGTEVFFDVHVWSRAVGFPEVKTLGSQVRIALNNLVPNVSGFNVHAIEFRDARYFRDGDGLSRHGVITFRTLVDAVT